MLLKKKPEKIVGGEMRKIKFFCLNVMMDIINFFLSQLYSCKDCKHSEYCGMKDGKICKVFVPDYINLKD